MSNSFTGEPMYYLSTSADRAARRERIATAALQGMLSDPGASGTATEYAELAIQYADALISELEELPRPPNGLRGYAIALRERDEARAEVERLRKEMREIAEDCESEYPQSYKKIARGIREALGAKP